MKITCVYAYPVEAEHLQRRLKKAGLKLNFSWLCWRRANGRGPLRLTDKPELILNIGFAGSLNNELPIGTAVLAREIIAVEKSGPATIEINSKYQQAAESLAGQLENPIVTLLSNQAPVTTYENKKSLAKISGAEVVDMEAYWLCRAAARLGVDFITVKIISDNAVADARSLIKKNKQELSKELSNSVLPYIRLFQQCEGG